jgi:hypothetical protein
VQLAVPAVWKTATVANVVKPLLDGLISALHTHDGSGGAELKSRLKALGEPDTVWLMLCSRDFDLLGPRTLVRRYRDGVTWNPADERCYALRVHQPAGTSSTLTAVVATTPI